ncbi:hypothetical protein M5K25_000715 [Dendrobium thyrsiflorum]|uniref:Uncharacterized protein n=1 Tax=Dendrobium thyrsiflorum TaxID=117978 RepID=A0ABD0W9X7_DENTH
MMQSQNLKKKDIFSKYELDKEKLISRYEQMRKKEKAALSELEKAFSNKIARQRDIFQYTKGPNSSNELRGKKNSSLSPSWHSTLGFESPLERGSTAACGVVASGFGAPQRFSLSNSNLEHYSAATFVW